MLAEAPGPGRDPIRTVKEEKPGLWARRRLLEPSDEVKQQYPNRWKPGQSGNPAGRPVGARQKIEESFLESLRKKWAAEGDAIVDRVAMNNPEKILEVMARVLPKELAVTVQQTVDPRLKALQQMDAEALAALGGLIDAIKAANVDGEPGAIFQAISENLPSWLATPVIEQK